MKIFYDTEFHERGRGKPINLLSIGAVDENGKEFYGIVDDLRAVRRANRNKWMAENVIPHLPIRRGRFGRLVWDESHPDYKHVMPMNMLASLWKTYVIFSGGKPELWAWYAAYDHVVMAQMFGRMIDLPNGVPMYTMDIKQRWHTEGQPGMPSQFEGLHRALDDARWNKLAYEYIDNRNE